MAVTPKPELKAMKKVDYNPFTAGPIATALPTKEAQRKVWASLVLNNTVASNSNEALSLNLGASINPQLLDFAFQGILKKHQALRTIFSQDGNFYYIREYQYQPMQSLDWTDKIDFPTELDLFKRTQLSAPIDLLDGPCFFGSLIKTKTEQSFLVIHGHNIICDGFSFTSILNEISAEYFLMEKNHSLSSFSISNYKTETQSPRVSVKSSEKDASSQLNYWKTKLRAPLPVLELPADFKRPLLASYEGTTYPLHLSEHETKSLLIYTKTQKTTLFDVLLSAFKITLSRHTNLEDIIVGSHASGGDDTQSRQTPGDFSNPLAVRTHIQLNKSFEDNLTRVTTSRAEAWANQDVPFQVVLKNLEYTQDSGRTPVFQAHFSYDDQLTELSSARVLAQSDLDLVIRLNGSLIEGSLNFRTDLFKIISIERFYDCFKFLLNNLSTNVEVPLLQLASLPAPQTELVLKTWNDTQVETSKLKPFHQMFESMALAFPNKVAIENSKGSVTYKELDLLSNKVAQGLIQAGIVRGDLVGVSLTRDIKMMAALIGILKSGAGYVPLDPAFPQERLDYMIESSTPKKLITETALANRFSKFGTITLIDDLLNDPHASSETPHISSSLRDTMYVIYTSGSTGNPKGVQISQGALSNFLISMGKAPGLAEMDKLLAVTTLSFDIATLEIYLPLTKGASVFLASSFDVIDGKALKDIIEKNGISVMQATPSTWRLMLAAGWNGSKKFKVLCGGESFPIDLALKLVAICGEVWNMYGPTETTVWSTCKRLSQTDAGVTIGRPIDNTVTYIMDEGHNLAPIGAAGELYIGGLGLAEGYFKRPDLTQERFIPNPFVPGEKIYATGDFARFTSEGEIECLGRQDGQVKVRGYRIELGEIEAIISKIPSIKENAVITKETRPGDVRIIAYLVMKQGEELDEKYLRENLGQKIPKYMIPSHFIKIDELPRTLNAKIDKKTLTGLSLDTKELKNDVVIPASELTSNTNPLYNDLRSMWIGVLGKSDIHSDDNFFNVGGNSLLAVQLFSKIAQKYKINLPLSLLLEATDFQTFVNLVKAQLPIQNLPPQSLSIGTPAFSSLIAIKASGNNNAVFCFHGISGSILRYMSLIQAVGNNRSLIGLQAKGLDGQPTKAQSVEQMARNYVAEMKLLQPVGPYFLAGESFGGALALEVAQELVRQGDKIEKLVMINSFGPQTTQTMKLPFAYKKKSFFNKLRIKFLTICGFAIPLEIKLFEIERSNYQAMLSYQPQIYDGDVHLIRPKVVSGDSLMGWSRTILGTVTSYEIEDNIEDFIESPQVAKAFSQLI